MDRYAYVNNNPINLTDPTGHFACGDGINDKRCDEKEGIRTTPSITRPNTPKEVIINILGGISLTADIGGWATAGLEQGLADTAGTVLIVAGCLGGPEGCVAGAGEALKADIMIASNNPLAQTEDFLGGVSLTATFLSDILQENNRIDNNKLYLGRDTIVSARNFVLGKIPESNIDAIVSESQVIYDFKRIAGQPGGAILISRENAGVIVNQVIWKDTFLQQGLDFMSYLFRK